MIRPSIKTLITIATIVTIIIVGLFILKYKGSPTGGSLAGIDENSNELWDDFESSVNSKFSEHPNIGNGAKQMGRVLQGILVDPSNTNNKEKSLSKAMSCLVATGLNEGLSIQESAELVSQVRDLMLTNQMREENYLVYNSKINGKTIDEELPDLSNCDFPLVKK